MDRKTRALVEKYQEELQWAHQYEPAEKVGYVAALDHAEAYYKLVVDSFDVLDAKANSLVQTAGAMTLVITATAQLAARHPETLKGTLAWALPSLAFFVLTVILAVSAQMAGTQTAPTSPRQILEIAANPRIQNEDQVRALVAASLHCAALGLGLATRSKARRLRSATFCLFVGLLALSLPVSALLLH